jgi:hypothetical protein
LIQSGYAGDKSSWAGINEMEAWSGLDQQPRSNLVLQPKRLQHRWQRKIARPVAAVCQKQSSPFSQDSVALAAHRWSRCSGLDERDSPIIDAAVQELDPFPALRPNKVVRDEFVVVEKMMFFFSREGVVIALRSFAELERRLAFFESASFTGLWR